MTVYFSEKPFLNEVVEYLKKDFPRGDIDSNTLNIVRANTINDKLFIKYFDCAVAKTKDRYEMMISLPDDLEGWIPFWYSKENGDIMIDPNSGPKGKNIYGHSIFSVKFQFYIDEKKATSFDWTEGSSTEDALIGEFIEIRHALIDRRMEPIKVFKDFYQDEMFEPTRYNTSKFLAAILKKK